LTGTFPRRTFPRKRFSSQKLPLHQILFRQVLFPEELFPEELFPENDSLSVYDFILLLILGPPIGTGSQHSRLCSHRNLLSYQQQFRALL